MPVGETVSDALTERVCDVDLVSEGLPDALPLGSALRETAALAVREPQYPDETLGAAVRLRDAELEEVRVIDDDAETFADALILGEADALELADGDAEKGERVDVAVADAEKVDVHVLGAPCISRQGCAAAMATSTPSRKGCMAARVAARGERGA